MEILVKGTEVMRRVLDIVSTDRNTEGQLIVDFAKKIKMAVALSTLKSPAG